MAQPSYAIEYLGAVEAKRGIAVTSASLLSMYPAATVVKMNRAEGCNVSVNGSVQFHVEHNDESYLTTGKTFIFSEDCIISIGIYRAVV